MVDYAKTVNLVFYIEKNLLLSNLSPPTVLTVELSNFNPSSFMVPSYRLVLYRTIDPLGSPWWTPPFPTNFVFYIIKKIFSPFRMIIYRLLSTGPMACIIYTPKPAVSRKVAGAGACVLGDCIILYPMVDMRIFLFDAYLQVIDFYVCWFYCLFGSQLLHTRLNSSVSRVSASWSKDRGFDPGFNSKIFFPQKTSEIILWCL